MRYKTKTQNGFTIVELLIVIVVIGILAAISIVAYNNISNNANDSAVKNDLANMAKKIQLEGAERGSYLPGGSSPPYINSTIFPGFTFQPSKSSYMTTVNNLFYCSGLDSSGSSAFNVSARSKSGKTFRYSSSAGLEDLGSIVLSTIVACQGLSSSSYSYGFYVTTGQWWSWTN